jgi:CMP-N-acetylneuraminic acid synthetase
MNRIFVHIGARKGSVGLKNKNLKNILGKPLIAWTINHAKMINKVFKTIVNTDSKQIANLSNKNGIDIVLKRPKKISNSRSSKFNAWKFAIKYLYDKKLITKDDIFIDLDCTCPLRSVESINEMIDKFVSFKKQKKKFDGIFTITEARKNPYFNLVEINDNGYLKLSKESKKRIIRRQDCPKVYEHVASTYIFKPEFIIKKKYLMSGKLIGHEIKKFMSWDIDNKFDFKIVEHLLKLKKYV